MTDNTKNKNNKGFLYPNTNKTKATHPDYTGKLVIEQNGVVFEKRVAAWENNDSSGKKYLSLIVSEPVDQENKQQNNNSNQTIQRAPVSSPISDDLEDLDAILRIADDDNPFNG
jgi:uncharacterized protein (DUF736 family)